MSKKIIWFLFALVLLTTLLFFTASVKEAVQWIIFNCVFFGLLLFTNLSSSVVDSSGEKVFGYRPWLIKTLTFLGFLVALFSLFSFFTGKFLEPNPGNRVAALIVGLVFLVITILVYFMKNVQLVCKADDLSLEYKNLFNKSFIFSWSEIERVSFTKDGYNSLILHVKNKKIKFQPFWSGFPDFVERLTKKRPNLLNNK